MTQAPAPDIPGAASSGVARVTGVGALPGGRRVTWTAADGRRGRRWRAGTSGADGRLVHGLLLETAPDGSVQRVEITTPAGLLTLHPEPDGSSIHGNCARDWGMEHLALPWGPTFVLVFDTSPVTAAVAARSLAVRVDIGCGASIPTIEVGEDLAVRLATWRAARVGERRWHLLAADGGLRTTIELDPDGLPVLDEGRRWPMEP
jgi:hypothetical protein